MSVVCASKLASAAGVTRTLPTAAAMVLQLHSPLCWSAACSGNRTPLFTAPLLQSRCSTFSTATRHGLAAPLPRNGRSLQLVVPFASRAKQQPKAKQQPRQQTRLEISVDVCIKGTPLGGKSDDEVSALEAGVVEDAENVLRAALQDSNDSRPVELSVVLCDDEYIHYHNYKHRGKNAATDVLSFAMEDDGSDDDGVDVMPIRMLGDIMVSLDTAAQQAQQRGYALQDEVRVLLTHGVLHLLGFDHELGVEAAAAMAHAEQRVLRACGWCGEGLIAAAEASDLVHGIPCDEGVEAEAAALPPRVPQAVLDERDVRLVAIDMDGTLLNSQSQISAANATAIRAAIADGVTVMLATGKARPAAMAACAKAGLAGPGLLVSDNGPGIFLQGIVVHDLQGKLIEGPTVQPHVVRAAFEYSQQHDVPLCAFLGDRCVTLQLTPELEVLHDVYYEPLAEELQTIDDILAGPAVRKLLFMTSPTIVDEKLKPHWNTAAVDMGAAVLQAVPTMLEIVPHGVNKWAGLQALLARCDIDAERVMAIGDGGNDFDIVANVGFGVAVDNAVQQVKEAAAYVVSSNDDDGVAEALETFVL